MGTLVVYYLFNIRFADGIVMLADSEKDMNQMLAVLKYQLNNLCLNINVKKVKTMVVDKYDTGIIADIKIDVYHIDQVKQFCFLGSQIANDSKSTEDLHKIKAHARLACQRKLNVLVNQNLLITTRKIFLKAFVWSVLTCAKHDP